MDQNDQYKLRQVEKKEELLTLAARIKDNFPYCIQMYNTLLLNSRELSDFLQYEFYVPKYYPDSHIIIWRTLIERQGMSIYCTEGEMPLLIKVLKMSQFPSMIKETPVNIVFLLSYQVDPVTETLQGLLPKPLVNKPNLVYAYVTPQNHLLRCPAGMKVQRLGKAGIQKMLADNPYWKTLPLDLTCRLAENLPALGVYLDPDDVAEKVINPSDLSFAEPEATPIACICTNPYGAVSMVMTDDQYRRRGLATLLVEILGRLHLVEGYFPHANVLPDNDASDRMFRKLTGWEKLLLINRLISEQ
ncbi:uncharacterized protein LOC135223532 [Macrobrachium nipponense]|uniref:uncharacterized protein LOC135223532 n=1 Tax=Macrobrachium nipponense TaxID=159736 RepID=UPI0030C7F442